MRNFSCSRVLQIQTTEICVFFLLYESNKLLSSHYKNDFFLNAYAESLPLTFHCHNTISPSTPQLSSSIPTHQTHQTNHMAYMVLDIKILKHIIIVSFPQNRSPKQIIIYYAPRLPPLHLPPRHGRRPKKTTSFQSDVIHRLSWAPGREPGRPGRSVDRVVAW